MTDLKVIVNIPMLRFATLILIQILAGAEVDLFIPSFPELQKVFNLSPVLVQLTLSVNFIAYCICCLFAGALGDRFNRRNVMLISLALFVLGSIACIFAPQFWVLVLGRALQGIGIAGPATLSYVIVSDECPIEKQPALLGIFNGMTTMAMAFAPVVGSYINFYFNWQANFVLLFGLGVVCFLAGFFVLPAKKGDATVSLSPLAYLPLLTHPKLRTFLLSVCLLAVPYWLFVGMAPILYMGELGVPLKEFGYYQGAIALMFSFVSIASPLFFRRFTHKSCFRLGIFLCVFTAISLLALAILRVREPMVITAIMLIFAIGAVFPVNILYPFSLNVLEDAKGRAAALFQATRLILTAFLLELVSYYYHGEFLPIGLAMFVPTVLSLLLVKKLLYRKWLVFN